MKSTLCHKSGLQLPPESGNPDSICFMLYILLRREDLFSTELAGSAGTQIHSKTINVPAVSEDSMVSSNQIRGLVISVFMSSCLCHVRNGPFHNFRPKVVLTTAAKSDAVRVVVGRAVFRPSYLCNPRYGNPSRLWNDFSSIFCNYFGFSASLDIS